MRAEFLIDAQWRVDSSESSLAERDNKLNAFRNRKRGHCAPLSIGYRRRPIVHWFEIRAFNYRTSYPILRGIFFQINRGRVATLDIKFNTFAGSMRSDNERRKLRGGTEA